MVRARSGRWSTWAEVSKLSLSATTRAPCACRAPAPPGLPAVDDLPTVVVPAGREGRVARDEEVLLEPEGLVAGRQDAAAEPAGGEVDPRAHRPSPAEIGQPLIRRGSGGA